MDLIEKYDIRPSNKIGKKLMVYYYGKWIHFGDIRYQHYFDKTGYYSNLNHIDDKRRNSYLRRANGIKDKNGNFTANNKSSPNFWSINILW